jgi:type IV secretion system protein TrbB
MNHEAMATPVTSAIGAKVSMKTTSDQERRQLHNLACHAGPIVELLQDPLTLDVVVNADSRLWVNRLGYGFECVDHFPPNSSALLLSGIATVRGIQFDHDHPILETIFPLTGDRIEGVCSPVVTSPVFAIRTRQKKVFSLQDMHDGGITTRKDDPLNSKRNRDEFSREMESSSLDHVDVIRAANRHRRNILMVGPTGSGKTTAANSVIHDWLESTPGDRVVIIEDTPELQCSLPNHVQLLSTAHISQAELLTTTLRLIPKRIVVGEVREEHPARTLLSAWNTGHSGGLATLHADDAVQGLRKLETLVGGHEASTRERIASAINMVIFIDQDERLGAGRKVREILVIKGYSRSDGDYVIQYV